VSSAHIQVDDIVQCAVNLTSMRAHSTCLTTASFDAGFDAAAGGDGGGRDGSGD
jgi:hypothetical protein